MVSHLEIVRQLRSPGVSRVHRDEYRAARVQRQVRPLEDEAGKALRKRVGGNFSQSHSPIHTLPVIPSHSHAHIHTLPRTPSHSNPSIHTLPFTPSNSHPPIRTLLFTHTYSQAAGPSPRSKAGEALRCKIRG